MGWAPTSGWLTATPSSAARVLAWSTASRSWPASFTRAPSMRRTRRRPGDSSSALAAEGEAKEGGGDQEQEDGAAEQEQQCGEREADGATEREPQLLLGGAVVAGITHRSDNLAALSTSGAADGKGPRGGPRSDRVQWSTMARPASSCCTRVADGARRS